MFAVDDFIIWFAWYFAGDVAMHPSTARLMEKAGIAINGDPPPTVQEHPERALDWLATPSAPPPQIKAPTGAPAGAPPEVTVE